MDISNKQFYILAYSNGKSYRLRVELIKATNQIEQYKVSGRNRHLVFQCDRPFLKAKKFKNKKPSWKLIEGNAPLNGILESIITEMEGYLKRSDELQSRNL
jgi:hypothetical protein